MNFFTKSKHLLGAPEPVKTLVPNSLGQYEFEFGTAIVGRITTPLRRVDYSTTDFSRLHHMTELALRDGRVISVILCDIPEKEPLTVGLFIEGFVGYPTERHGEYFVLEDWPAPVKPQDRVSLVAVRPVSDQALGASTRLLSLA